MKVYTRPLVRVIARPSLDRAEVGSFLLEETGSRNSWVQEDMEEVQDGDSLPEFCGRMCYVSFGGKQGKKTNRSYIGNIISQGHGSVLEHSNWTFLVTRCSRGFTHELVRHRAGFAFSQESTHYIDYSDPNNWSICIDPRMLHDTGALEGMKEHVVAAAKASFQAYADMYACLKLDGFTKKDACSMARQILPTGIESKIAFTANARALRHFVEYRGNAANVLEIRDVAIQVCRIMKREAPSMFSDFQIVKNMDGLEVALNGHRKV